MAGYTPLFDTLTKGTLCGKWPDIGLWPIVLSLADRHGVVDYHPNAISGLTGLPADDVAACMARFCEPDPMSRSCAEGGARLTLLDKHRGWGWRIVNYALYSEKVRLINKNAREVEEGKNRDRLAKTRTTADDRRGPPPTADDRLCKLQAVEDSPNGESARKRATRLPDDFSLTAERRLVAEAERLPAERTFASFCDYWRAEAGPKARKLDWDATWRNWCRREENSRKGPAETPQKLRHITDVLRDM